MLFIEIMPFGYLGVSVVHLSQNAFSGNHYIAIHVALLGDMACLLPWHTQQCHNQSYLLPIRKFLSIQKNKKGIFLIAVRPE